MKFDQYIQIKTDSLPKGARSVALSGLASRRKIHLENDNTPKTISIIIKNHYQQSDGKIELFGNITGYQWRIFEDMQKMIYKVFDIEGNFIKDFIIYDKLTY